MRTKLERAHDISSIGTFVLTIIIVALMVIPMLWPLHTTQVSAASSGNRQMITWLMPSLLAFCLVLAAILNLLAAHTRHHEPSLASGDISPSSGRIFLGPDITPQFLYSRLEGYTAIQAKKLLDIYVGKWMKLSGAVDHVSESSDGSCLVRFRGEIRIYMSFEKKWIDQLSILRPGSNITVIGRIESVEAMGVNLGNCELV